MGGVSRTFIIILTSAIVIVTLPLFLVLLVYFWSVFFGGTNLLTPQVVISVFTLGLFVLSMVFFIRAVYGILFGKISLVDALRYFFITLAGLFVILALQQVFNGSSLNQVVFNGLGGSLVRFERMMACPVFSGSSLSLQGLLLIFGLVAGGGALLAVGRGQAFLSAVLKATGAWVCAVGVYLIYFSVRASSWCFW